MLELLNSAEHCVIDPLQFRLLFLRSLETTKAPLTLSYGVLGFQPLELLDYEDAASVPHLPHKPRHFKTEGRLELEELVDLHRIERCSGLPGLFFDDKLAKVSELDEAQVLEVLPPALKRLSGNVEGDEVELELAFGLLLPLVVTCILSD